MSSARRKSHRGLSRYSDPAGTSPIREARCREWRDFRVRGAARKAVETGRVLSPAAGPQLSAAVAALAVQGDQCRLVHVSPQHNVRCSHCPRPEAHGAAEWTISSSARERSLTLLHTALDSVYRLLRDPDRGSVCRSFARSLMRQPLLIDSETADDVVQHSSLLSGLRPSRPPALSALTAFFPSSAVPHTARPSPSFLFPLSPSLAGLAAPPQVDSVSSSVDHLSTSHPRSARRGADLALFSRSLDNLFSRTRSRSRTSNRRHRESGDFERRGTPLQHARQRVRERGEIYGLESRRSPRPCCIPSRFKACAQSPQHRNRLCL